MYVETNIKTPVEVSTIMFLFIYYVVVDVDEPMYTFHVLMLLINNLCSMMRISRFSAIFKLCLYCYDEYICKQKRKENENQLVKAQQEHRHNEYKELGQYITFRRLYLCILLQKHKRT